MLGSVRIERPFGIITYVQDLCICLGLLRVSGLLRSGLLRTGKLRSAQSKHSEVKGIKKGHKIFHLSVYGWEGMHLSFCVFVLEKKLNNF